MNHHWHRPGNLRPAENQPVAWIDAGGVERRGVYRDRHWWLGEACIYQEPLWWRPVTEQELSNAN